MNRSVFFWTLLAVVFLPWGSVCRAQWDGFLVDLSNCVSIGTQIALDRDNWPHVTHYDATNQAFKYTRFDGFHWHGALIDTERGAGRGSDIALDNLNQGHISYRRRNGTLMYIQTQGRVHSAPETVLEGAGQGATSLALDRGGNPHIALFIDGELTYVRRSGGDWITERLGVSGSRPSLALGPDNTPHLIWISREGSEAWGRLYYSARSRGGWVHQLLDPEAHVSGDTALAVDGAGQVHLAYLDWLDNMVKYALGSGDGWALTTLANNADRDQGLDLALDSQGRPHVVYTATGPVSMVKYGRLDDDLGWVFEVVADGAGPALDIDVYDRPHTAFSQDGTDRVPGPWPISDCRVLYYSFRR